MTPDNNFKTDLSLLLGAYLQPRTDSLVNIIEATKLHKSTIYRLKNGETTPQSRSTAEKFVRFFDSYGLTLAGCYGVTGSVDSNVLAAVAQHG